MRKVKSKHYPRMPLITEPFTEGKPNKEYKAFVKWHKGFCRIIDRAIKRKFGKRVLKRR